MVPFPFAAETAQDAHRFDIQGCFFQELPLER
jgi:hypothetical protein